MLTNKQIRFLRNQAHNLNFLIQTGDKGLTDSVINEIKNGLAHHELIKVKLNADKEERNIMEQKIVSALSCEKIQTIGKITILFKQRKKDSQINLPKA